MNKHLRRGLAASALVASGLALGHVADAAIPSSTTGQITACANDDHAVRLIDAENGAVCDVGETTVAWNAYGGTAYSDYTAGAQTITGGLVVASVTLPPGDYVIQAKTNLHNLAAGVNFVQCGLTVGGENGRTTLAGGTANWEVMQSQIAVNLASATTVDWFCNPNLAAEVTASSLVATTVSDIQ